MADIGPNGFERTKNDSNRIAGIVLVTVGILVLLFGNVGIGLLWPIFVLVPGLIMIGSAFVGHRRNAALAVPGTIVTVVGLLLLVMSLSGYWEAWSYAWALIIAAAGFGTFLHGALEEKPAREKEGMQVVVVGLTLFAIVGGIFEFFIFGDLGGTLKWVVPLALIVAGAVMLFRRAGAEP
jgi:hypothetical protein